MSKSFSAFQAAFQQGSPEFDKTFPAADLEQLVIDADVAGNLAISCDADEEARVMAKGYEANPHLAPPHVEQVGSTLYIRLPNLVAYTKHMQRTKLELLIRVPSRVRIQIRYVAGVVLLNGGEGDLSIRGGAGTIEGTSHAKRATVRLGAGEIQLADLHAQARLEVGCGTIDLHYKQLTGEERIDARCGLGSIDVHLPPDEIEHARDHAGLLVSRRFEGKRGSIIQSKICMGAFDLIREEQHAERLFV